MPSGPEEKLPIQVDVFGLGLAPDRIFQWSVVDETSGGKVLFQTTIDIDASDDSDISQEAWCRMASFFLLSRLSGKALLDACNSLAEIYSWQIEQVLPALPVAEQKRVTVSRVRQVERAPFVFDEN